MRAKRHSSIGLCAVVILLCLVMSSGYLAMGSLARFNASADADVSAKIAHIGTTVIPKYPGVADPLALSDSSGNVTYRFHVDNRGSEVAVKYGIEVVFFDCYDGEEKIDDVEDAVTNVKVNSNACTSYSSDDEGSIHYFFNDLGYLEPGAQSDVCSLTFNISESFQETTDTTLDDGMIYFDAANRFPIQIFVRSEQVD